MIILSDHTGLPKSNISSLMSELRYKTPTKPKRVYVKDWSKYTASDGRIRHRPVFALGDLPDADKPPPRDISLIKKEWRDRQRRKTTEEHSPGLAGFQWPPMKDSDE